MWEIRRRNVKPPRHSCDLPRLRHCHDNDEFAALAYLLSIVPELIRIAKWCVILVFLPTDFTISPPKQTTIITVSLPPATHFQSLLNSLHDIAHICMLRSKCQTSRSTPPEICAYRYWRCFGRRSHTMGDLLICFFQLRLSMGHGTFHKFNFCSHCLAALNSLGYVGYLKGLK